MRTRNKIIYRMKIINTIYAFLRCNVRGGSMVSIILDMVASLRLDNVPCLFNMAYNSNINLLNTAL